MISGSHHVSAGRNLMITRERKYEQDLYEEENGSCKWCYFNNTIAGYPRCQACVNGHGKQKNFRPNGKKGGN